MVSCAAAWAANSSSAVTRVRAAQFVEERIQLNGKIRRSFVLEALPCHPQVGMAQESSSFPNISMAWSSESERLAHFFCKLMLWWPLGHSKTNR